MKGKPIASKALGPETVGGRIRELRIARGWTLAKLGQLAGISQTCLSDIERGDKGTTRMAAIATALGVPLQDIERS